MQVIAIAIAEDEDGLREALVEYFEEHGFEVLAAPDPRRFREVVAGRHVDVAVLDVTMPGEDGLSLGRWLRARSPVGLIYATAHGRPVDRVVGLESGADDYVVKPYDLRELLARVRSLLRRMAETPQRVAVAMAEPMVSQVLRLGRFLLDPGRREIRAEEGAAPELSQAEFDILEAFARRPGRVLGRAELLALLGEEGEASARAIDVRIARLRRKIERDPETPEIIVTVRGVGYLFPGDQ